jgi:hypothetical protein
MTFSIREYPAENNHALEFPTAMTREELALSH